MSVSVSQIKSDARNLASMVDEQLSACRALRSDATVQQVLNQNQMASAQFVQKRCAHLLLVLKSDIRALHERHEFASEVPAAEVFRRTHLLENELRQTADTDMVTTLSSIIKLLELKESLSVSILSQILKEKEIFDEESLTCMQCPMWSKYLK